MHPRIAAFQSCVEDWARPSFDQLTGPVDPVTRLLRGVLSAAVARAVAEAPDLDDLPNVFLDLVRASTVPTRVELSYVESIFLWEELLDDPVWRERLDLDLDPFSDEIVAAVARLVREYAAETLALMQARLPVRCR